LSEKSKSGGSTAASLSVMPAERLISSGLTLRNH